MIFAKVLATGGEPLWGGCRTPHSSREAAGAALMLLHRLSPRYLRCHPSFGGSEAAGEGSVPGPLVSSEG